MWMQVYPAIPVLLPNDASLMICGCRYILPSLSLVPNDAEESVRVEFTGVVAQLAATAYRFLQQLQSLHAREQNPTSASMAPALVGVSSEFSDISVP